METNPYYNSLTEEAVDLIISGLETLESCRLRYGGHWKNIASAVQAALELHQLRDDFETETRPLDVDLLWSKLKPRLELEDRPAGVVPFETSKNEISALLESTRPLKVAAPRLSLNTLPPPIVFALNLQKTTRPVFKQSRVWVSSLAGRLAVAILVLGVLSGLFVTVTEASAPGDTLYGAKLSIEHLGEWFAGTDEEKAQAELAYAGRRLGEIEGAIAQQKYTGLDQAVSGYWQASRAALKYTNSDPATLKELTAYEERLVQVAYHPLLPANIRTQILEIDKNWEVVLTAPSSHLNVPGMSAEPATPDGTTLPAATVPPLTTTLAGVTRTTIAPKTTAPVIPTPTPVATTQVIPTPDPVTTLPPVPTPTPVMTSPAVPTETPVLTTPAVTTNAPVVTTPSVPTEPALTTTPAGTADTPPVTTTPGVTTPAPSTTTPAVPTTTPVVTTNNPVTTTPAMPTATLVITTPTGNPVATTPAVPATTPVATTTSNPSKTPPRATPTPIKGPPATTPGNGKQVKR